MCTSPPHKSHARGWLVVAASLGLHALLLVFIPEPAPPAPPPPPAPVAFEIVDVPEPEPEPLPEPVADAEPEPPMEPGAPVETTTSDPVVTTEPLAPAEPLATPEPSTEPEFAPVEELFADAGGSDDDGADVEPSSPQSPGSVETVDGGPADAGQVRLFDSAALGDSVGAWKRDVDEEAAARAQRREIDPNSTIAEASRVTSRVVKSVAEADVRARVAGGFTSSCEDGLDNDKDGRIDCADPNCRKRRECAGTGVYEQTPWMDIPEADTVGVSSTISVTQDGMVKKLSVRVQVSHSSPGDMTMVLENVDTGKTVVLHEADRSDSTLEPAFFLYDFNGTPAKGTWRLRIRDEYAGNRGKLKKWWLYVTS